MSTITIKQCDWPGCPIQEHIQTYDWNIINQVILHIDVCPQHWEHMKVLIAKIVVKPKNDINSDLRAIEDKCAKRVTEAMDSHADRCQHYRLDEDGICRTCGGDHRGIG